MELRASSAHLASKPFSLGVSYDFTAPPTLKRSLTPALTQIAVKSFEQTRIGQLTWTLTIRIKSFRVSHAVTCSKHEGVEESTSNLIQTRCNLARSAARNSSNEGKSFNILKNAQLMNIFSLF